MKIHTTANGEKIEDIAKIYGIDEEILRLVNEIKNGDSATGEELLIQAPTRTHTVAYGDTIDGLALRFGVRKNDILLLNPWINENNLHTGQKITLKCAEKKHGMAVSNGYFYKGCPREKLIRALPYLTYVSFASAVADKRGVGKTFDDKNEVRLTTTEQKIPLIRVHDYYQERYKTREGLNEYAEMLIELALNGKYRGIVLNSCSLSNSADVFIPFMMLLRKLMIGCDLILITEINENSPIDFSEFADGSILYYPKFSMEKTASFDKGERKVLGDFALNGESAKTFIDLPSLCSFNGGIKSINDALTIARQENHTIQNDKCTLLSFFSHRKQGEYKFNSLSSIKSILELINELDYMGICFDIMRTPLNHLIMYNAMFKTAYTTTVRSPEGCSRANGE